MSASRQNNFFFDLHAYFDVVLIQEESDNSRKMAVQRIFEKKNSAQLYNMAFDSHCMQMYAMVKSMTKNLPDRKQIYLTESQST